MGVDCVAVSNKVKLMEYLQVGGQSICKEEQISHGGHGNIFLCSLTTSNSKFALKQTSLKMDLAHDIYEKEVKILKGITKVGLEGSIKMVANDIHPHKTQGKVGRMLLELGQETLLDQFNSRDFKQTEIFYVLKNVTKSLKELHSIGIIHFDIKPQNIIRVNKIWKLCDFGSALTSAVDFDGLSQKQKKEFREFLSHNTTEIYSAPEMIEPEGKVIDTSADIWMLGCIAYILVYGCQPFSNKEEILIGEVKYPFECFMTEMIRQMLSPNPRKRPSASALNEKITSKIMNQSMEETRDEDSILEMVFN